MWSTRSDCAGVREVSAVDSRVDIVWSRPFRKVEKQNRGVDENHEDEADQEHRERITTGPGKPEPTQEQKAEEIGPHGAPFNRPSWRWKQPLRRPWNRCLPCPPCRRKLPASCSG